MYVCKDVKIEHVERCDYLHQHPLRLCYVCKRTMMVNIFIEKVCKNGVWYEQDDTEGVAKLIMKIDGDTKVWHLVKDKSENGK
jgi:hypothetical protein